MLLPPDAVVGKDRIAGKDKDRVIGKDHTCGRVSAPRVHR